MQRKASNGRRSQRHGSHRTQAGGKRFRRSFESLEARHMLSAQDLLVSLYDGGGTLRYNEAAGAPAAGAAAPGDKGVTQEAGVAVAPDGSYYVSSPQTQEVLHYSNSGAYLGTLGEDDADPVTFEDPGVLAFGPSGNLYVADIAAGAIYQFNLNSPHQEFQSADTTYLAVSAYNPSEVPFAGGFTFAANGDLIVGDLSDGSVATYDDGTRTGYLVYPYTAVGTNDSGDMNDPILEPSSILAESNGNLLIADLNLQNGNGHHQVVLYTASTGETSPFLDFSNSATNAPVSDGFYSQPESLLLDQDGNLLVGVAPQQDNSSGAVLKYNINTGAYISTVVAGVDVPAGLAYIPSEQSDLLVNDYDDSAVSRYDDSSDAAVPGGVVAGSSDLAQPAGVAVAPDGTYYVSSSATREVLHYSSAGVLLGTLGEDDGDPVTFEDPGVLAFGPSGNLYVADIAAGAIYQFNLNSPHQEFQSADTTYLAVSAYNPSEVPFAGGFTFAANGDLIVGDLSDGSVATYDDGARTGYLVYPYTAVGTNDSGDMNDPILEPSSILAESNGNLLIADLNLQNGNGHHQVVLYTASTGETSPFLDFSNSATNAPVSDGFYSQPESLLLDQDGNLLVGVAPQQDNSSGAVLKYNINTGAYISTVVAGVDVPSGVAMIAPIPIVTTSGGATNYTAGEAAVTVDSGLTLSDANTLPDLSATVTITGNYQVGDALHFTNTANITGSVSTVGGVYTLTLTGSDSLADYQAALNSITFSSTSTSTSERTIAFTVTDGTQTSVAADKLVDVSAPVTIIGLYISGSAWTSTYDSYLSAHSLGSSTMGYAMKTGAAQLSVLPWANANTIDVQFSGPVTGITTGSFKLVGGTGSGSVTAPSITAVSSLGGNAYQISLSGSLGNNKYVLAAASTASSFGPAITDANGAGISGTFTTTTSTFPSGNGLAGSTFDYFFDLLPGNETQNGLDNASDTAAAKAELNFRTTTTGYNYLVDYNGAGLINATDGSIDNSHNNARNTTLTAPTAPSGAPVGGSGFTALALGVQESGSSSSGSSSTPAVANVIPATSSTTSTTSGSSGSSSGSGGSGGSTGTSTTAGRGHGSHSFAATDEAVSDFELADLWR